MGGYSLYIECRGEGRVTLVFLVGTNAPRDQMSSLEEGISVPVRICRYDRAGNGKSQLAPRHQTYFDFADDLHALLASAKVPGPYVLVGQSVGGGLAWTYAGKYGNELGGFLLMNAGPFFTDWVGLAKVWTPQEISDEKAAIDDVTNLAIEALTPPLSLPYVVVISTVSQCGSETDVCGRAYPLYETWAKKLAARTPNGTFVEIDDTGHEIFDWSAGNTKVVAEIETLLEKIGE